VSRYDDLIDKGDDARRLSELFDRTWRHLMDEHPEVATMVGWPSGHDRWTDFSVEAVERRRAEAGEALPVLDSIDVAALDEVERTSHEMYRILEDQEVDGARFPAAYLPLNQMEGPQLDAAFLLSLMPRTSGDDLLARVRTLPELVEQSIELLERGRQMGVTVPRAVLDEVPAQVEDHLREETPVLGALAGAADDVVAEGRALVHGEVAAAYRRLHEYLVETYLPAARDTIACTDLPDGREWYAERVRYHTTTDLSPEEIHEIGQSEVTRITAVMEEVQQQTGFVGDRAAFAEHLRTDPRHYFDTADALLAYYRDIAKRIDPEIVRFFTRMPALPYGITAVPDDQAPAAPAAFYLAGSVELNRAGMFYANTYDLASRPAWNMESICLHEAVPGHHFQIALAQETEGLPEFRRQTLACTAYAEGWGLYCESLGKELGMYTDPYQHYGALDAELMRACRLVLDTGMHALGWSREQAADWFIATSPSPEHDLRVEVDRYIVWPGQALSYKVGELKIRELRQRFAGEDLRGFHDEVLRHGALPLGMLERLVEQWAKARTAV
jgi:uncharacterized protein (DUF885 family)